MSDLKMLNLGCGKRFHPDWVNVDFVSSSPGIIAHNLTSGIPFSDNKFDVVYHSHVLEHFSKKDAANFIAGCYRVLRKGGTIRVAVPDLERIALAYLEQLNLAVKGDKAADHNYDWMMLEMYDQTVRNSSGGGMAEYLAQDNVAGEDFIYSRIGEEYKAIRAAMHRMGKEKNFSVPVRASLLKRILSPRSYLSAIRKLLSGAGVNQQHAELASTIGKFRLEGEIHQWMYDRYSLARLLKDSGFGNIVQKTAFESSVPQWNEFGLESKDGIIFKPDSLFMEAVK